MVRSTRFCPQLLDVSVLPVWVALHHLHPSLKLEHSGLKYSKIPDKFVRLAFWSLFQEKPKRNQSLVAALGVCSGYCLRWAYYYGAATVLTGAKRPQQCKGSGFEFPTQSKPTEFVCDCDLILQLLTYRIDGNSWTLLHVPRCSRVCYTDDALQMPGRDMSSQLFNPALLDLWRCKRCRRRKQVLRLGWFLKYVNVFCLCNVLV